MWEAVTGREMFLRWRRILAYTRELESNPMLILLLEIL